MSGDNGHPSAGAAAFVPRATDRIESVAAWVLASLGLLGAIAVLLVGTQTHASLLERVRTESATRTPVAAVITQDTPPLVASTGRGGAQQTRVPVRWVGTDGVERVGEAIVVPPKRAGDVVTAWADREHELVPAPMQAGEALVGAGVAGGIAALWIGMALWMTWWAVRRCILAANRARWAREWACVEPLWSGRAFGESTP